MTTTTRMNSMRNKGQTHIRCDIIIPKYNHPLLAHHQQTTDRPPVAVSTHTHWLVVVVPIFPGESSLVLASRLRLRDRMVNGRPLASVTISPASWTNKAPPATSQTHFVGCPVRCQSSTMSYDPGQADGRTRWLLACAKKVA